MNLAGKILPGLYKTADRLEAENLELREQRDAARVQRDRARERNELLGERLRRVENSRYELWSERYGSVYSLNLPPEELQNHIGSIGRGSHEYIRERWSEFFEVSEIVPQGIQTHDVAICRARG